MLQKAIIIFTTVLLLLGCGTPVEEKKETLSTTAESTNYSRTTTTKINYITTLGLHGVALDIALSDDGNYAYIASGDYGLQIVNIKNPKHPELLEVVDTYGYVNHIEVINNIAYLSYAPQTWENYESINAFNITDPNNPKFLGYYEGYKSNNHQSDESESHIITLNDNTVYATSKRNQNIYDSYELYDPYALTIENNYIYVANGRDGLTVLKMGHF
ncbi:MAG: hypothetical protein K0U47_07360 [Epsilonproteobacteria bacterium]|nr:hypothetical protein [Campylobacterota bacterium]